MIQIGAHLGGPKASAAFRSIHVLLNEALARHASGKYSDSVDYFGVMLCVSGNMKDFGTDGLERLAWDKRTRSIGIDIVIPQDRWLTATPRARGEYVTAEFRLAIDAMLTRLARDGADVDAARLHADVERALADFLAQWHPST